MQISLAGELGMDNSDRPPSHPPSPPPKRLSRPKITLQIPDTASPMPPRGPPTASSMYPRYHGRPPGTPGSHMSDPHVNPYFSPFGHMYHNKASDFMFKQFAGFKDFTMNTAKSGLSAGEKSAFWFVSKLRSLSKRWFTHLFLSLCLILYSVMGAAMFMALEGPHEIEYDKNLTEVRREFVSRIQYIVVRNRTVLEIDTYEILRIIDEDLRMYENKSCECLKHINNNNVNNHTWSFWNAMFYAGTIYTTIVYAFQ